MRIVFVCLGNICRSPIAEAVMRQLVREKGLENFIDLDSSGTGDWHIGKPPHAETINILEDHGVDWKGIKARQVTEDDLQADYIIAMDAANLGYLHRLKGITTSGEIHRLLDFTEEEFADVPDPYFTGEFEEAYQIIDQGCRDFLAYLLNRHSFEK